MSEYDYILDGATSSQPAGPSRHQRLLVVLGGLVVLTISLWLIFGVLLKPDHGPIDDIVVLAANQTEMAAIANASGSSLRTADGQALAQGSQLVLTTDRQAFSQLLDGAGRSLSENDLQQARDQPLRDALNQAQTNNRFDEVFTQQYGDKLAAYRLKIQEVFGQTTSEQQRETLRQAFNNVSIMLGLDQQES